jgi:hypothetical protein
MLASLGLRWWKQCQFQRFVCYLNILGSYGFLLFVIENEIENVRYCMSIISLKLREYKFLLIKYFFLSVCESFARMQLVLIRHNVRGIFCDNVTFIYRRTDVCLSLATTFQSLVVTVRTSRFDIP